MIKDTIKIVAVVIAVIILAFVLAHKAPASEKNPPTLTSIERLTLENNELKIRQVLANYQQQLTAVMTPLQAERNAEIEHLKREHPGWEWHDAVKEGEVSGFRKIQSSVLNKK